ncbi:hypothetical protein ACKI1Q_43570, partial [Streptomyces galilaeus]|uniref:hypothetical protein n=1 Tax=Streptomyces galilaeus TaxID=33899 RepID=UPI0038F62F6A
YSDGYAIEPGDKTTLFIHRADQMSEIGGKARARQYMNANGVAYGDGYFVTALSDNMDAFLADPELEGAPIVELNDIKLVTLSKKSSADAAARAKIQVFKWTGGNVYPYSSNWNPAELDDDATDVVYITIKS